MFFDTLVRIAGVEQKHAGRVFTPQAFTHLLRSQFVDSQLRFSTTQKEKMRKGCFQILGEYRPSDDEEGNPCIFINIVYSADWKKIKMQEVNWPSLAFCLADILTHEYLHQYYIRKRNFKFGRGYRTRGVTESYNESMKEYLGCEDEILAFGFSAAAESVFYQRPLEKTRIYKKYLKCFADDKETVLKLKRQAVKYIKSFDIKILESYHEQSSKSRARGSSRNL